MSAILYLAARANRQACRKDVRLHIRDLLTPLHCKVLPLGRLELFEPPVRRVDHTHALLLVLGDDTEGALIDELLGSSVRLVRRRVIRREVPVEQLFRLVRGEPFFEELELGVVGGGGG